MADLDLIKKAIKDQLKDWLPPSEIDLIILQHRSPENNQSLPIKDPSGPPNNKDFVNDPFVHNLTKNRIQQLLGNPLKCKEFGKDKKLSLLIIGLLLLVYVLQISWEAFYPSERLLMFFGVNRFNFYEGNYLGLIGGTFLHGSWSHLILNLLALHYLGTLASRFFSWKRILIIYLMSAVTGLLASVCFLENTSVGASGAIFGLAGAVIAGIIASKHTMGVFHRYQFEKTLDGLLALIAINSLLPFIYPQIDIWGHTGGLGGGFLLGFSFAWVTQGYNKALALMFFLLLMLSLWIGARSQSNSFMASIRAKEQAQTEVLEWMNLRILPLQKEIEFLLGTRQSKSFSDLEHYILALEHRMSEFDMNTAPPPLIKDYLVLLREGIRLLRSDLSDLELEKNWKNRIEYLEKKVMDSFGLVRKSENF